VKKCIKDYRRMENWENFFLDSAIYSVAEQMGVRYDNGFTPIAAETGDLFTFLYAENMPCDSGLSNYVIMPESVMRALESFGCQYEYLSKEQVGENIPMAVEKIRTAVDQGIPVLAWGVGGVPGMPPEQPMGEGALIGGYDDEEENILLVHLYCGAERLPAESFGGRPGVDEDGYTAIPAETALKGTDGLFIPKGKGTPPTPDIVYRDTILRIPTWMTLTPTGGRVSETDRYRFGKEAFRHWAAVLAAEQGWQNCDEEMIWNKHCSAFCTLCTAIGSFGEDSQAVDYLRRAAAACPSWLLAAELVPLYEKMSRLWQQIWEMQAGFMPVPENMQKQEYRRKIAAIIQKMGDCCDEILQIFEKNSKNANL